MSDDHFDLKKVRRNWDLAVETGRGKAPGPLADVKTPLDPFVAAREDMARLRELLTSELSRERKTLEPFLSRIERALTQMQAVVDPTVQGDGTQAGDVDSLRPELDDALYDLEDLLEVLTMVPR